MSLSFKRSYCSLDLIYNLQQGVLAVIDPKIEDAINGQINQELTAAYSYLAIAAHFEKTNLSGFANWMHQQRLEELDHAMKLFNYLIDRGGEIKLQAVENPHKDFGGPLDVFKLALGMEQNNTKSINELYRLATDLNDYATQSHLKWFIDEQVEEEKSMEDVIAMLELAGDDRSALLVLNQQMGSRQGDPAAVTGE